MHTETKNKQLSLTAFNSWMCEQQQNAAATVSLSLLYLGFSGCRKPQILASGICFVAGFNVPFLSLQVITVVVLGPERS